MREPKYKRRLDLGVLVCAHIVLAPVLLILWIVIMTIIYAYDRNTVFYRQKRLGRDGVEFELLKFRSMRIDAEGDSGPRLASNADDRITPFGRLLRRTALDELPQVLNIWRGDMSFVGPRAERAELHAEISVEIKNFGERLKVRPGLTGLAQLNGAYDLHPSDKLLYDLEYVAHLSFWLDIRLIYRSMIRTLTGGWDARAQ